MTAKPKPDENNLLKALDALTKPQRIAQWQGEGEDRKIFKRLDPPLLDWLQEAIGNNIGGGGGGKPARERAPMDFGAFTLYEDIDGRVRSWLHELGAKPGKHVTPTQMLRTWYTLWNAQIHTDSLNSAYASILEGWEDAIKDKLDPPKRIEITSPCPACGAEFVNVGLKLADGSDDPDDVERVRVLNAVERERIEDSYAMCAACNRVWLGVPQMRALRIAIDDAETAKLAGLIA